MWNHPSCHRSSSSRQLVGPQNRRVFERAAVPTLLRLCCSHEITMLTGCRIDHQDGPTVGMEGTGCWNLAFALVYWNYAHVTIVWGTGGLRFPAFSRIGDQIGLFPGAHLGNIKQSFSFIQGSHPSTRVSFLHSSDNTYFGSYTHFFYRLNAQYLRAGKRSCMYVSRTPYIQVSALFFA